MKRAVNMQVMTSIVSALQDILLKFKWTLPSIWNTMKVYSIKK